MCLGHVRTLCLKPYILRRTFMIESANFMTQDTSKPLNARLATTISVIVL